MFEPFMTTGIGSLPHTDPEEACRLVIETFDIPFWPQLPKLSFHESMITQFSEGMPFIRIDSGGKRLWIERDDSNALTAFYETYSEDWKAAVSEFFAKGLYTLIGLLRGNKFRILKGQVTGPLTFTLGLKDSEGRLIYFDEELREISLMLLKAKVRWQMDMLKPFAEEIVLFVDEPILSALGSTSYIGVEPREALRLLQETTDSIRHAGGIPGIHCCGNADWSMVIKSGVNIISFDAYDYVDTISLYPAEFTEFLQRGGYLAWGVVPTTDSIKDENIHSLKRRFHRGMALLSESIPAKLLLPQTLLTPSCGMGSRSINETLQIFQFLRNIKEVVL